MQSQPVPAIVYQLRSSNSLWAPEKLDVTAGGHYKAGESVVDGLREVREEIGKDYDFNRLTYLGHKLNINYDVHRVLKHHVVDIFMVEDNNQLETYRLEATEVSALYICPINDLLAVHQSNSTFEANGITATGEKKSIQVTKDSFPVNWDPYHYKIILIAKRFLAGEKNLIY